MMERLEGIVAIIIPLGEGKTTQPPNLRCPLIKITWETLLIWWWTLAKNDFLEFRVKYLQSDCVIQNTKPIGRVLNID